MRLLEGQERLRVRHHTGIAAMADLLLRAGNGLLVTTDLILRVGQVEGRAGDRLQLISLCLLRGAQCAWQGNSEICGQGRYLRLRFLVLVQRRRGELADPSSLSSILSDLTKGLLGQVVLLGDLKERGVLRRARAVVRPRLARAAVRVRVKSRDGKGNRKRQPGNCRD